ncbi:unnamed protein product, partial [marine sediment metagenome]
DDARAGRGEMGGNNSGWYVKGLRIFCGFPRHAKGAWCAIFGSAKIKQGYLSFKMDPPFALSRGAYRLVMNIGESERGEFITVPEPGFACWKRRGWTALWRKAHFRIMTGYDVETDTMHYVAGNENALCRVGSLKHGAWRKDLIKMVTIR